MAADAAAPTMSAAEYIAHHNLADVADRLVFRFNTHAMVGGGAAPAAGATHDETTIRGRAGVAAAGDVASLLGELLLDVGLHGDAVDRVARLREDAFECLGVTLAKAEAMLAELEDVRRACPRAASWDEYLEAERHVRAHIESHRLVQEVDDLHTSIRETAWGGIDCPALHKQLGAMRDRYHALPATFRTHTRVVVAEKQLAAMAQAATFVISTATDLSYFWSLLKTSNAVPFYQAEAGESLPFCYVMDALKSRKMQLPAAVRTDAPPPPNAAARGGGGADTESATGTSNPTTPQAGGHRSKRSSQASHQSGQSSARREG